MSISMSNDVEHTKFGGIDVGGSKIEAGLFSSDLEVENKRRQPAPKSDYESFLGGLLDEIRHLRELANDPGLPVGIGLPGIVSAATGLSHTSNLPCSGRPLVNDILEAVDFPERVAFANDMKCFALSEANGGAGDGFKSVFGLIMGTGLGGGHVQDGQLLHDLHSGAGEFGHIGIPAVMVEKHGLPLLQCGCGRVGCFETLLSGTGLGRLAHELGAVELSAPELSDAAAAGNQHAIRAFDVWEELFGEFLFSLQLSIDPACVVLGGGLSNLPDVANRLDKALKSAIFQNLTPPEIRAAKFGDSSGTRGAALLVRQKVELRT